MPAAVARPPADVVSWTDRFARRSAAVTSSAIRELLALTQQGDVISFAGGLPSPDVFPVEEIREAAVHVLSEQGSLALQYGATEGYAPFRELLVRHMGRYGISVGPENVLVTAGSQSGLDLLAKLLLDPGDLVVTEAPTYLGALQAFRVYEPEIACVPLDDAGLRTDLLEEHLRRRPKFVYVLPNFQNPSGTTLSLARRKELVELCHRHHVLLVEDDPYGQLRYEGEHLPPLAQVDAERAGVHGGVLYLGTLSKVLAPGLRLGFVVGGEAVIRKLTQLKQGADLQTATFTQMVAHRVARAGFLDQHVRAIRDTYRVRRDAMLRALDLAFPPGVTWTRPHGGLFLWVTLPKGADSAVVLRHALEEKVAFVPGAPFFADGRGAETLRLNFSYCRPETITEGIRRLGGVLHRTLPGR